MAGTEGELLSGWSCVVHRPSEDPEPSELPSTVDITAFSSGLSVEPANEAQQKDNSDSESDSEADSSVSCQLFQRHRDLAYFSLKTIHFLKNKNLTGLLFTLWRKTKTVGIFCFQCWLT